MFSPDVYFIDINVIYQIFAKNIWYISKLLIVAYVLFYLLPIKIFPQKHTGIGVQKIVFNFIYMVAYIEVVVTFLVFIKIFSLLLFIFVLVATKLAFLKWYYKKNIILYINHLRVHIMLRILNLLDYPKSIKDGFYNFLNSKIINFQQNFRLYKLLQRILFFTVFTYIISVLILKGLYSYADAVPDTSQFIEWVGFLQKNSLYWNNKAFGADFYGISIMIFFINIFTNIDPIILFSLYPVLLLIALYLSIYYVLKDFTSSKYIAIFAVMVHGIIFMSPLSNFFLGRVVVTSSPQIVDLYGLKFYIPTLKDTIVNGNFVGYIPYVRYISGMAYEHSSVFVLLNAYFLIKILELKSNIYLILYALTLMLVFTFHGGGAIVLVVLSLFITINALIFRKLNISILKKGLAAILFGSIIGNLWILSMIKYGIPPEFGAAAPFLDKILHTKGLQVTVRTGLEYVRISEITTINLVLLALVFLAFIFSFFTKRKFLNTSFVLIIIGIFFIYFIPNIGLPLLTKQSRLAEYMFFALTLLFSFYFFHFIYQPLFYIFKKYARYLILSVSSLLFIFLVLSAPKWINSKQVWKDINGIEYTSIPDIVLKINKKNRPFAWTIVSYVQEYAKVLNKGYHINSQQFILRYKPNDKYLKIPTKKIYIFIENYPNPYKGMEEWYYRWRSKIQDNLKSWAAIYSMSHDNIKLYYETKTVTVYEIDNTDYIDYLRRKIKK